jgi:small subunit ribosomal protein S6
LESYEITFIVRPDLDEDQIRGVVDGVTSRINSSNGEVIATFPWNPARRRLAYPINDFGDGFYVTTTFRFPPDGITELERALRLNENLLRFLVVQATELSIQQSQQRSQQAAAAAARAAEQHAQSTQTAPASPAQAASGQQPQVESVPAATQAAPATDITPVGPESAPEATAPVVEVEVETQPEPQPAATVEE